MIEEDIYPLLADLNKDIMDLDDWLDNITEAVKSCSLTKLDQETMKAFSLYTGEDADLLEFKDKLKEIGLASGELGGDGSGRGKLKSSYKGVVGKFLSWILN